MLDTQKELLLDVRSDLISLKTTIDHAVADIDEAVKMSPDETPEFKVRALVEEGGRSRLSAIAHLLDSGDISEYEAELLLETQTCS